MENIKINYNKFKEDIEKNNNEHFKKNSIFFSGLCKASNFEFCEDFWNEFTLKSSINIPNSYDPIDQLDVINSNIEIINSKVIKTPSIPKTENFIKNFENKLTTERKLIVTGFLCLTINYISIYKDKNIQSFNVKVPFSNFIVLSKKVNFNNKVIDPLNVKFITSACLENINITQLNDTNFKFVANIFITACCSECLQNQNTNCLSMNKLTPEIYGLCNDNTLNNILISDMNSINYWNQTSLSKTCTLPLDKPNIVQILSVSSKFKIINTKLVPTPKSNKNNFNNLSLTGKKLLINALFHQQIDYISNTDNKKIISIKLIIPISSYIMVPLNTNYYNKFNICLCLEDVTICKLSNRQFFSSATIFLKANPTTC